MSTTWDPEQYLRFAGERSRGFEDLVARIGRQDPHLVVDLGCGPGNMTARLADRWPDALVVGIDNSPEMLEKASRLRQPGSLEFAPGDLRDWSPPQRADVVISSATLQWVPGHVELLPRLLGLVGTDGLFGFTVPGNFDQPSHRLLHELATSERWRDLLAQAVSAMPTCEEPAVYMRALLDAGAVGVDVWESTYFHLLEGPDAVLEWMKGTGMRPFLQALAAAGGGSEEAEFLTGYAAALRAAYPPDGQGKVVFPFRRIFAVARR